MGEGRNVLRRDRNKWESGQPARSGAETPAGLRAAAAAVVIAAAALLLYLGVVAPVRRESDGGPASLKAVLGEEHRRGLPVLPAQLQAPLPPPQTNAAPLYARLAIVLQKHPIQAEIDQLRPPNDDWTSGPPLPAVQGFLDRHQDLLALAQRAADRPVCGFKRNWTAGPWARFPELEAIHTAAWLIFLQSLALAREGRLQDAVRSQSEGFRIAAHASSDPVLLADYVGLACEALTLRGMAVILHDAGPNLPVVRLVLATLHHRPPDPDLARALAGEAVSVTTGIEISVLGRAPVGFFDRSPAADEQVGAFGRAMAPPKKRRVERRMWVIGLVQAAEARQLRDTLQLIDAAGRPYPERLRRFEAAAAAIRKRSRGRSALYQFTHPGADLIDMAALTLAGSAATEAKVVARGRVVEAAAVVMEYRAIHGDFPARLEDTAAPLDPYTGGPLDYHRTASGFTVSCPQTSGDASPEETPLSFAYQTTGAVRPR
ncbi:MAG: hypothetical protein LC772_01245 [Chloroflexi bacterium]|nr:hypothetical protein [Chloroflexota bacterium]